MFTTWQRALAGHRWGKCGGQGRRRKRGCCRLLWAEKGWLDSIALSYVNGAVCAHKVDQCCYGSGALMSTSSKMHFTTAAGWAGKEQSSRGVERDGEGNSLWSTGSPKHATSTATIILQLTPNNSQPQNDKQLSSSSLSTLPSLSLSPLLVYATATSSAKCQRKS